jgi:hypothetical protein
MQRPRRIAHVESQRSIIPLATRNRSAHPEGYKVVIGLVYLQPKPRAIRLRVGEQYTAQMACVASAYIDGNMALIKNLVVFCG